MRDFDFWWTVNRRKVPSASFPDAAVANAIQNNAIIIVI